MNTVRASDPDDPTIMLEPLPAALARGACATGDVDPAVFFPRDGSWMDVKNAKAACAGCPVLDVCLGYALRTQRHGIWGGMTATDRTRHRAKHDLPAPIELGDTR